MDPEFVRVTSRVIAVGTAVLTLGTIGLVYAFRRFGVAENERDFKPFAILVAVAIFILLLCVGLLRFSFVPQ